MSKILQIGQTKIRRGERVTLELPIARLYTFSEMNLPVHVVRGRQEGPRLFVCAALHGDELNGVEVVRRLLKLPQLQQLRGTLIAVPVVNMYGFVNRSRYLPDRRDLNRSFPGTAKGSLTSSLARLFMDEIVSNASHGIDLHTGSDHRSNLPQVRAFLDDPETERLARAFGAPVIINAQLRDSSLRQAVMERGIPMLLYEGGEALRFSETAIRTGLRGVVAVMRALEMLPPAPTGGRASQRRIEPLVAKSTTWVRAPKSGMLFARVKLGESVVKEQVLGFVSDPMGTYEDQVLSPSNGIVIGRLNLPLVHRGDALFHIARFKPGAPIHKTSALIETDLSQESSPQSDRDATLQGHSPTEAPPTEAPPTLEE